jgi:hypothetical protein
MRKIKFKLLTRTELVTVETDARTFGQLKTQITANKELNALIQFGNNQFIERDTKVAYGALEDALLPVGDCFMFVIPMKTKSGCDLPSVDALEEMGYSELRSLGSKLNKENGATIDLSGKRVDILDRIAIWLEDNNPEVDSSNLGELADDIMENANAIIESAAELKKMKLSAAEEPVALKITLTQLQKEAEELKKLLG